MLLMAMNSSLAFSHAFDGILVIGLIVYLLYAWFRFEYPYVPKGLYRIPSPPSWPILGHSRQLSSRPQKELKAWAQKYGELFQIRLGLHRWIYINSVEASREIMEKQVAHTSSRIPSPVSNDIIGGDMRFVLMPGNAKWNLWRKVTHRTLTPTASLTYIESQELEATQLVLDCLTYNKTQKEFYWHMRRFATSVIMSATYGWRVRSPYSNDLRQIYDILRVLSESSVPGRWIADSFTFLAKLPTWLHWWRRSALEYYAAQERAWMTYWLRFRANYEAGKSPDCFSKQLITSTTSFTELEKAFLAGTNVEAGAESISTTLNSTMRYLALHPEAQAAALLRINACIRETGRLRPPTTNGVIHYTTADISYAGYHIPAGSVVAMNQYALYYDPVRFPQPEEFRPERWLVPVGGGEDGQTVEYKYSGDTGDLPDRWLFGAGKRICVGMHLSINSM